MSIIQAIDEDRKEGIWLKPFQERIDDWSDTWLGIVPGIFGFFCISGCEE